MNFSHKENAKVLFTKENIGTYWNDLYKDVSTCLDYHFQTRLRLATEIVHRLTPSGGKLLDLGCGSGVLTEQLLKLGHRVDAADMSSDMLEFARQRLLPYDQESFKLIQSECENLKFADNSYDVIACIGVFGYIDDVDSAINEIYRVLKPGGTLVMSIRNEDNLNIFDLHNIAKNLFYKLPKKLFRLFYKQNTIASQATIGSEQSDPVSSKTFISIWDRPRDVIKIFSRPGFSLSEFDATGYGPIQYQRKTIGPEGFGKWFSRTLEKLFRATGLHSKTKWIADISIYVFQK